MPKSSTSDLHNEKQALKLVMDLMAIPGGSGDESQVAEFIRDKLIRAGVPADQIVTDRANLKTPLKGNTGNLMLRLPGTVKGPRRLLAAHMDTVPICVGGKPVIKGSWVRSGKEGYGIGADDRAGCAVILNSVLTLMRHGLDHPPLTVCWFVQEEIGLHGARCVNKSMLGKPKLAFNWDGGSPHKLTIGATGGYRIAIDIRGIASHAGGAPEWGVSAIAIASLAIAKLQREGWHGDIRKNRKHGTSNVGVIEGGKATNVVTDHVFVKVEARSHDAEFRKVILEKIRGAFQDAVKQVTNVAGATGEMDFVERLDYESFRLDEDEPCVEAARQACQSIGLEPELAIANGGVDANWLAVHGIPTVTLGCGQTNQHMATEALDIDHYQDACRLGLLLATAAEEQADGNGR